MKYQFNSQEHLHLLDGVALTGTTTILEVLGKPLTYWASGKAVEKLGWTNEFAKDDDGKRVKVPAEQRLTHLKPVWQEIMRLDEVGVLKLLDEAYKAHATNLKETASDGTDLHAELEKWIKMCLTDKRGLIGHVEGKSKKLKDFIDWSLANVKRFIGSEVYVYNEEFFIGGIIDCIAELKDGNYAIIDFKSSKDAYFSQFIQCALYHLQVEKNGAFDENGNQLFKLDKPITKYIVFPFGGKTLKPVENNNIIKLQNSAKACIEIYRTKSEFEN